MTIVPLPQCCTCSIAVEPAKHDNEYDIPAPSAHPQLVCGYFREMDGRSLPDGGGHAKQWIDPWPGAYQRELRGIPMRSRIRDFRQRFG